MRRDVRAQAAHGEHLNDQGHFGSDPGPDAAFEVLMGVSGYRRTNLRAEIIDAHRLRK